MGIVLGEAADAEQPVQGAGQFVTVNQAQFRITQRQFLVGVGTGIVNHHAAGTVHGFDGVIHVVDFGEIHVFPVMIPVAGPDPQLPVQDHGGHDLFVMVFAVHLVPVFQNGVADAHAVGMEEGEAGAFIVHAEDIQLFAQFAVVAFLCFFQHVQIFVQLFLAGEGGAVNTLQHLVLFVAPPVSARQAHQFKSFYTAGGRAVGAGAQVGEVALGVQADNGVFRQVVDQFYFIDFLFRCKAGQRVLAGHFAADQRDILFNDFCHFLFNSGQIFRCEDMFAVDIVIETGIDGRADGEFYAREQMLDGLGHHVGRGMADGMKAFFGIGSHKFDSCVFFNRITEVFVDTVHNG